MTDHLPDRPVERSPWSPLHAITLETRGSYSRARCTCRWAFQSPDFEAVRLAAGEHVEAHAAQAPTAAPAPGEQLPEPDSTAAAGPVLGDGARQPTLRELAQAAVEVNHISRHGIVDVGHVEDDVTAVLALTGEHERAAVLAARHRGYARCLRAVLEEVEDLDGHDPAAVLAHLRHSIRERIASWEEQP